MVVRRSELHLNFSLVLRDGTDIDGFCEKSESSQYQRLKCSETVRIYWTWPPDPAPCIVTYAMAKTVDVFKLIRLEDSPSCMVLTIQWLF